MAGCTGRGQNQVMQNYADGRLDLLQAIRLRLPQRPRSVNAPCPGRGPGHVWLQRNPESITHQVRRGHSDHDRVEGGLLRFSGPLQSSVLWVFQSSPNSRAAALRTKIAVSAFRERGTALQSSPSDLRHSENRDPGGNIDPIMKQPCCQGPGHWSHWSEVSL